MNDLTTSFIARLRTRDPDAWFELWETFGPVLRSQLSRWGRGRIGRETVQDLSQETLVALASAIDRHDPSQGARFSTWLLAIARYTLGDEIDRRMAQKRGSGVKPLSLDARIGDSSDLGSASPDPGPAPDTGYEQEVFDAKVEAALRAVEREVGFEDFEVFRMRILQGRTGRAVAEAIGTSEPTVSRRLARVRTRLKEHLFQVFSKYSFTPEEWEELERNGLDPNPNRQDEAQFELAVAEVYHRLVQRQTDHDATPAP